MTKPKTESIDSLSALLSTIQNYDNKATSLLSAVGIIFGFSIFSIEEMMKKTDCIKTLIHIFGLLYLCVFVGVITTLVLIVFPRRRNKNEIKRKKEYVKYSEDLYSHFKKDDLDDFVRSEVTDEVIIDQIKNCTRIVHVKETLLRISTLLIIIFAILLSSLVILLFI